MNAIVLACEKNQDAGQKVGIDGKPFPFLPLAGRPLLLYVLMALDRVAEIDRITVIGPQREVMQAIESVIFDFPFQKKILVLAPKESLSESICAANKASENGSGLQMLPQAALILPASLPFVTSAEISTFLSSAKMQENPFCLSASPTASCTFLEEKNDETAFMKPPILQSEILYQSGHLLLSEPNRRVDEILFQTDDNLSMDFPAALKLIEVATEGHTFSVHNEESYHFVLQYFEQWREGVMTRKDDSGKKICSISGDSCESE